MGPPRLESTLNTRLAIYGHKLYIAQLDRYLQATS